MYLLDSNSFDVIKWAADRFSILGWSALIIGTWRISTWFSKAMAKSETAVAQVNKLATEHFPAIKESLSKQDGYLKSMDDNLKTMVAQTLPSQYEYVAVPAPSRYKRQSVRRVKRGA